MPGTDIAKLRASTIQTFAAVTTVLRPHAEAVTDPATETGSSRWPKQSQAYCVYTRRAATGDVMGIVTFGLSNPYQNTFYFAIGIGIEILVEAPVSQARVTAANGTLTGVSISESWMFAIVHEIAHQCFQLGIQIRQLLEKLHLLSVEIGGVNLPPEYLDPDTQRCCVLLGHLGDPEVPRGFNVTVPHQQQWILQSVLFVPARVLTFAQCHQIRTDGAEARKKLADGFVAAKTYSISHVPIASWVKPTAITVAVTQPVAAAAAAAATSTPAPAPAPVPEASITVTVASQPLTSS